MGFASKAEAQAFQKQGRQALTEKQASGTVQARMPPLPPDSLNLPVRIGGSENDKALLPRILSDEIAFRSELLARVQTAEAKLLQAIDQGLYSIDKASLPALANSLAKLVQVSERLVERTKGIAIPETGTQVSGLYAKYALLQQALRDRGLVGPDGALRNRRQAIAAIDVDVQVRDAGSGARGQGGIGTGSLSDGGSYDSSLPPSPPPGVSAQVPSGSPADEPLEGDPDEGVLTPVPSELLPLGPPTALDGPRRNEGYRRRGRRKKKGRRDE